MSCMQIILMCVNNEAKNNYKYIITIVVLHELFECMSTLSAYSETYAFCKYYIRMYGMPHKKLRFHNYGTITLLTYLIM